MATDVWPVTLPQVFEVSSYSEGVADVMLENQPDVGPSLTRRRSTASFRPVSGTMVLTETQIGAFKVFFNTTISGGTETFTFPAQDDVGSPVVNWLVKFTKDNLPKWMPLGGGYFRLSLNLVILP